MSTKNTKSNATSSSSLGFLGWQRTAQVSPQIDMPQPINSSNLVLSNTGNLPPIQPATNLNNPQGKNLDDNSLRRKKPVSNEKRGPRIPEGSTRVPKGRPKGTSEQKLLLAQQPQSNDIIKGKF